MQLESIDKYGRIRPFRRGDRLEDGEILRVPLTFMDAAARAGRDVLALKYGLTDSQSQLRGFVRGYANLDGTTPRALADAAAEAYEEKRARLHTTSRQRDVAVADDTSPGVRVTSATDTPPAQDAAQGARALAYKSWQERNVRISNAWRIRS
jgi:hypothetical protein